MLSLVIETTTGSYHQAVHDRVFTPAAMSGAEFVRTDDLPTDTALGYLENGRSNVFHLPVVGMGDGGAFLTLNDMTAFWDGFSSGCIVSLESVAAMTSEVSKQDDTTSYGRGFWLVPGANHVWIEGIDAGVSFQSGMFRSTDLRYSMLSNTSSGAWPLVKLICDDMTQPTRLIAIWVRSRRERQRLVTDDRGERGSFGVVHRTIPVDGSRRSRSPR